MTAHHAQECPPSSVLAMPRDTRSTAADADPPSGTAPGYLPLDGLCGPDSAMHALVQRSRRLIERQLPLLILGETGTGKEYLARALHAYSQRRQAAMVALNCASIPENLVESELFGYQRGAFSGALPGGMKGKVVLAHQGTLFLDEIGDMPAAQQTRLLRVLSEREVTPIGAARPTPVDVQLICATHQDLAQRVERGEFREDLYYRIAVGVLELPALRERDDRAWLLQTMLAEELPGRTLADTLAPDVLDLMMTYDWPGNLRQMRAALRYACAVTAGDTVSLDDLPAQLTRATQRAARIAPRAPAPPASPATGPGAAVVTVCGSADSCNDPYIRTHALHSHAPVSHGGTAPSTVPATGQQREILIRALTANRWNISAAARQLGMCRASLYRKLKQFSIPHVRDMGEDLASAGTARMAL